MTAGWRRVKVGLANWPPQMAAQARNGFAVKDCPMWPDARQRARLAVPLIFAPVCGELIDPGFSKARNRVGENIQTGWPLGEAC
jgi:hypothetical protein